MRWILFHRCGGFFGTDFTDGTDICFFVAVRIWVPKFLLHPILRRGRHPACSGVGPQEAFELTKESLKNNLILGLKTRFLTAKRGF
jgi:hypothetical protein